MTVIPDQSKRRLLPRWRPFGETSSGELASAGRHKTKKGKNRDKYLEAKLAEWEREPSIALAVDILSSALVVGRAREFEQIGWWVLTRKEDYAPAIIDLARICVHGQTQAVPQSSRTRETVIGLLRRCRSMVGDNPKDSLLYIDMALAHAMLGNLKQSERAIKIATRLAPDNRFVLRSAARFWMHVKRPDVARSILGRSARTQYDPWLLAAELSVSSAAEKTPRFIGAARVFLHDRSSLPNHTTELAGAMGTIEALDGRRTRARDLFRQSLVAPTENAVAQAVWASQSKLIPELELEKFSHLRPNEAVAWQARSDMKWTEAIDACARWAEDEAYSTNPSIMGSFMASVIDRSDLVKDITIQGLVSNPGNFGLRNNLAVADILLGNVEKAVQDISDLGAAADSAHDTAVFLATSGLAFLYLGQTTEGRALYEKSIKLAADSRYRQTAAYAAAFWARAELKLGLDAQKSLEAFEKYAKGIKDPEIRYFQEEFANLQNRR